jgi:hypothetical protein
VGIDIVNGSLKRLDKKALERVEQDVLAVKRVYEVVATPAAALSSLIRVLYVAIAAVWIHSGPATFRGVQRLALVALLVLLAGESLAIYPYY